MQRSVRLQDDEKGNRGKAVSDAPAAASYTLYGFRVTLRETRERD